MNKILVKPIILFLLFSITSCSYKPIFLEKNYDFQIREISLVGDKDINRTIQNKLKFIKNNDSKDKKSYSNSRCQISPRNTGGNTSNRTSNDASCLI